LGGQGTYPLQCVPVKLISRYRRRKLFCSYKALGSIVQAAKAAGVSIPTAYRYLADYVKPAYPARLRSEARRLYLSGMSCRRVTRELRVLHDGEGPSQETIHQWMRMAGILRSKSRADEIHNAQRSGRDIQAADDLRTTARRLVRGKNFSVTRVAAMLGVCRKFVIRACKGEVPTRAGAQRLLKWWADLPEVEARRRRRALVIEMRLGRATYPEITKATGLSTATISVYLREARLTNSSRR
jgi:hypothetical protein